MSEEKEDKILAREYTLPTKKPKGPRPTVSGVRRKKKRKRRSNIGKTKVRLRKPQPEQARSHSPSFERAFPSIKNIIIMLESPSEDVIKQGIKTVADISGEPSPGAREIIRSLTKKQYKKIMKNLVSLAQQAGGETSYLAHQALDRFRWARQEVGMLRIAKDQMPKQWIFRDGTVLPFAPPLPPSKNLQRRKRGRR